MNDPTDPTDPLSSLGRKLLKIDPAPYGALVVSGGGSTAARDLLESVRPEELLASSPARAEDARAILAGLWLYYDWLDESHKISQSLASATGSFWHAIMHRREGDFSNSKYWYARCAEHPTTRTLAVQSGHVVHGADADKSLLRVVMSGWDPAAYVDLVEAVHESPKDPRHRIAISLQRLEWQLLFDHCTRAAAEP